MSDSDEQRPAEDSESTFHLERSSLDDGRPITRPPRRRWVRVAEGVGALVVLVGLLYAFALPHGAPPGAPPSAVVPQATKLVVPTPISYKGQPLTCPDAATWSPDGAQVAILYYLDCGGFDSGDSSPGANISRGGALAIYADPTQAPTAVLALDPLVINHGLPASVRADKYEMSQLYLSYPSVSWSPDGTTLVVVYSGDDVQVDPNGYGAHPDSQVGGIITMRAGDASASARVINVPRGASSEGTNFGGSAPVPLTTVTIWNLTTDQAQEMTTPVSLAYQWGPGGTLTPTQTLSTTGTPPQVTTPGPVGQSAGNGAFTLWQVAQVQINSPLCNVAGTPIPGSAPVPSLVLEPSQPIWSPDGAQLITSGFDIWGWIKVSVPPGALANSGCSSGGVVGSGQVPNTPQLPIHDAGMHAALVAMASSQTVLYWSPDGERLVMEQLLGYNAGSTNTVLLTLYDCASGQVITGAKVPIEQQAFTIEGPRFSGPELIWSPDGQRLLVLGSGERGFTILDASQLGG